MPADGLGTVNMTIVILFPGIRPARVLVPLRPRGGRDDGAQLQEGVDAGRRAGLPAEPA